MKNTGSRTGQVALAAQTSWKTRDASLSAGRRAPLNGQVWASGASRVGNGEENGPPMADRLPAQDESSLSVPQLRQTAVTGVLTMYWCPRAKLT